MEYRTLDVTLISADNLKNVNMMSTMDVYVAVTVSGDPRTLRKTTVHRDGGRSPRWNQRISLPVSNNSTVVFNIYSNRVLGDRLIGELSVPVRELLDAARKGGEGTERMVEYQVRTASGKAQGTLKLSYKFGEKIGNAPPPVAAAAQQFTAFTNGGKTSNEPVTAYPHQHASGGKTSSEPVTAYPPQHAAGYPPPQYAQAYPPQQGHGYPPQQGYGYPPQQGYGYPPQQGYGYPPQQGYGYPPHQGYGYGAVPPRKKPGMGGMGLGLGAGLLGGLLVGDMISDVGSYDAGFDDGGGFDF